jgi:hypothetical protein
MSNTLQMLIETSAERGAVVNETEAAHVLLARQILKRDPENALAKEVVQNFGTHLSTGKEPWSFAGFMLQEPVSEERGV